MDALNHGEIVGTHHLPDAVIDHAAENFSNLNHDLNSSYSSHVESISQGLDQHSHDFLNDLHPNTILHSDCVSFSGADFQSNFDHLHNSVYIETPSFESHLSTNSFHAVYLVRRHQIMPKRLIMKLGQKITRIEPQVGQMMGLLIWLIHCKKRRTITMKKRLKILTNN